MYKYASKATFISALTVSYQCFKTVAVVRGRMQDLKYMYVAISSIFTIIACNFQFLCAIFSLNTISEMDSDLVNHL